MRSASALVLAMTLAAGVASAQEMQHPACAGVSDAGLSGEWAGWTAKAPLASADRADGLAKASLPVGKSVVASLHPTREVAYAVQPEKPDGSVAKGGMFELRIAKAGTYVVALNSGPWIDVIKDGKALVSINHGGGPACTAIRKVVEFKLDPGLYVIQLSANPDPTAVVMVALRP